MTDVTSRNKEKRKELRIMDRVVIPYPRDGKHDDNGIFLFFLCLQWHFAAPLDRNGIS